MFLNHICEHSFLSSSFFFPIILGSYRLNLRDRIKLLNVLLVLYLQRDEVSLHKKLRTEVIQLEDTLAQVRKEYEMLRIEFEQTLAANEQAGQITLSLPCVLSVVNSFFEIKRDIWAFVNSNLNLGYVKYLELNPVIHFDPKPGCWF